MSSFEINSYQVLVRIIRNHNIRKAIYDNDSCILDIPIKYISEIDQHVGTSAIYMW